MYDLQIFEHEDFGKIRVIERDGKPWFVAADVCRALEMTNTAMSLERLDEDEKYKFNLGLSGGDTWCVNEPGLYSLVLGSRKPEAKVFKRWITHEVIPAIRKTGTYSLVALNTAAPVAQRALTSDDYLRAAVIVANCRNERLPYVLGFLEKGGWEIPKLENTTMEREPISTIINRALAQTGLTMAEIERRTGLSRIVMCRYRTGQRQPKPERYDYIVSVLSCLTEQGQK